MLTVFFTAFSLFGLIFIGPAPPLPLPCAHTVLAHATGDSRLLWPDGRVQKLPYQVNALAREGQRLYALANRRHGEPFGDGAHLIAIESNGAIADRGSVGLELARGYAGTMVRGRYHVATPGRMYVLDPVTRAVLARVPLGWPETIGDWEHDPVDDVLYGVTSAGYRPARLLRVDPASGAVRVVAELPGASSYGAVYLGPGRVLYALRNDSDGHSTWYAIPLAAPGTAHALGPGPAAVSSDATGCRAAAPPPRPAPPAPTPSAVPPPPAPSVGVPRPPSPPAPTRSRPSPPTPRPTPPPFVPAAAPEPEPVAVEDPRRVQRWVAVMAVGFVAGGMAARRMRAR